MNRFFVCLVVIFASSQAAFGQPAQVIIIRHAEKPDEGNGLSLRGRERAAALAPFFLGTDTLLENGTPVAIYAQAQKHDTSSVRPIETVKPLAKSLGLTINKSFERDDFESMVKEVMQSNDYKGHTVVICWEHAVIPKIAAAFGASDAPKDWDKKAYDRVWIISFPTGEKPKFEDLPQQLMIDDSKN